MKVPVLLIVFNRLETTQKVFDVIRAYKPLQLFIAADGPRLTVTEDADKCITVQQWLLDNVDWDCDVKTLFQKTNIGCGKNPATAISWFFEHVLEGVILEDDTVPHIDFFEYANSLLAKYRDNNQIMAINSSNFQEVKRNDGSYYFSMQNGPFCGWATWKRAWKWFDFEMEKYSYNQIKKSMKWYGATKRERDWWLDIYMGLKADRYHGSAWDFQFIFAIWVAKGKSIVPNVNLSTNIGFGPGATHTTDPNSVTANRKTSSIMPMEFPSSEIISREADLYYHDFYYDKMVEHVSLFKQMKRWVKKKIRKISNY